MAERLISSNGSWIHWVLDDCHESSIPYALRYFGVHQQHLENLLEGYLVLDKSLTLRLREQGGAQGWHLQAVLTLPTGIVAAEGRDETLMGTMDRALDTLRSGLETSSAADVGRFAQSRGAAAGVSSARIPERNDGRGHGITVEGRQERPGMTHAFPTPNANVQAAGTEPPFYIVGVGASAGGLEALEKFFDNMRPDSGMAFVVIQHLSPDFKSLMDELLRRHTAAGHPSSRRRDGGRAECDLPDSAEEGHDHFGRPPAADRQGSVAGLVAADRHVLPFAGPGRRRPGDRHRAVGHRQRRFARHPGHPRRRRAGVRAERRDGEIRRHAAAARWTRAWWTWTCRRKRCRPRCCAT